jgi:hypothetical protein
MKTLSKYKEAKKTFLAAMNSHFIEPKLRFLEGGGAQITSISINDCAEVRYVIRNFASAIMAEREVETIKSDPVESALEMSMARYLQAHMRDARKDAHQDWAVDREDGLPNSTLSFRPFADDFSYELFVSALKENASWNFKQPKENLRVLIHIADLDRSIEDVIKIARSSVEDKYGWQVRYSPFVRVFFDDVDAGDAYQALLTPSSGSEFSVSGSLNGSIAYQLNGETFNRNETIGRVILEIAGAPRSAAAKEFFSSRDIALVEGDDVSTLRQGQGV